ncbi:MAG TPA: beta-propeller fold lactonase family protein, partial [Candidatus Limnocylindria bacterium]|nr:beta-propeller fold lactonase family protein [Candidatus Limnocylindria bacterium]
SLQASDLVHNAKFSSDGAYFAHATFNGSEAVVVYKVQMTERLNLKRCFSFTNCSKSMKIKGIHFTKDNRFIALAYACSISSFAHNKTPTIALSIHEFDVSNGSIGGLISKVEKVGVYVEDIAFICNDHALVASSQGDDALFIYPFDHKTGRLDVQYTLVQNPDAQLSFPHGMSVSQDGKYLAVTNYGDDKFNLYQINNR